MATLIPSRLAFFGRSVPGHTIEARWIVGHPMESGLRTDDDGKRIARNMITLVRVFVAGKAVLELEPGIGMAANPYLASPVTVPAEGGFVRVEWVDDKGAQGSAQQLLLLEK